MLGKDGAARSITPGNEDATEPQGGTRAILYEGNIEYEIRGVLLIHVMRSKKKTKKRAAVLKLFRGV